jgi:HK97 family phage prohead protease
MQYLGSSEGVKMDKIFKAFTTVSKAVDIEAGIFDVNITTEAVDRMGDIVRAAGGKLENYLKNPVVLWAHDYATPPVARALSLEVTPGEGIKAQFQFAEWGVSELSDTVRRLWASKFLNATSIGFIPIKSMNLDDKAGPWGPKEFVEWELLEFSIVPVPANQEALSNAIKSLVTKSGRVLSAKNEKQLRDAQSLIENVLATLGEEPDKSYPPEKGVNNEPEDTEPNNTEPSNDASEVARAIKLLTETFTNFK